MSQRYAVVDIETTGGMPRRDKITEIGIVIFDGQKILDQFSTLINPERSVPPSITRITGITTDMVAEAPKFYEVAKTIVEMTEGCIFVAHNVRFDYQFLQNEFKSLGFTFSRRKLCTVVLSRKAFPELRSHSLGNLIKHFGIKVKDRHRALDDAIAAAEVLKFSMERFDTKKAVKQFISTTIKQTKLPQNLNLEDIESLPKACGVYYFKDTDGNIVYIGKSIDIQKRAKQHFSGEGRKANRLFREVAFIEYQVTGSELLSLLLESDEIKTHQPGINVAQKTNAYPYSITSKLDSHGYKRLHIYKRGELAPLDQKEYGNFSSRESIKSRLSMLSTAFELCKKLCDLEPKSKTNCFNYTVEKCLGACIQADDIEEYNDRVNLALESLGTIWKTDFLIIEYTQNPYEKVVFCIQSGKYVGYSIYPHEREPDTPEFILNNPDFSPQHNPEHQTIVENYILSHPHLQIVEI